MQNETKRLPYRDPVLTDGLLAAPLAVFCEDFAHGLTGAFVLAVVMLIAVPLTALVPRKLPLSVRILFYSAVCALVYIPAALFAATLFPTVSGGIWLPVIALMPAVTVCRDRYFGGKGMFRNLLRTVLTVSLLMTVFAAVYPHTGRRDAAALLPVHRACVSAEADQKGGGRPCCWLIFWCCSGRTCSFRSFSASRPSRMRGGGAGVCCAPVSLRCSFVHSAQALPRCSGTCCPSGRKSCFSRSVSQPSAESWISC